MTSMEQAREESLHIAIGRVFELTLATATALDATETICREALATVAREAHATDSDYMWAVHTHLRQSREADKFRQEMHVAMCEGRAVIWPPHNYD